MDIWRQILISFPYALLSGLLIALACSAAGVFVVLKRLVFLGAVLLETAACGIAAAFFFRVQPFAGAVFLTLITVTLLALPAEEKRVPRDALMAAIFVLTSALSMLFVSRAAAGLDEVKALLYGDLILTTATDFKILAVTVLPAALLILIFLRPLTLTFMDREEAKVLGIKVRFWELLFFYAAALMISASSKLGGMILVFCHLVIPPMAGLLAAASLPGVFLVSAAVAVVSTLSGFYISYAQDLPVNQVIAVISCMLLALIWTLQSCYNFFRPFVSLPRKENS